MIKAISKRQALLKEAIASNHAYPLLTRGDKNSFDNFAQMSKTFVAQMKQAKLSFSLAEHLVTLYNKFLEKLQALYIILSEFDFDSQDEHGLSQFSCPSLEWCKKVQDSMSNVLEFPFHQQFFSKVLFANPNNKYNYSLFDGFLNDASGADDTIIAADSEILIALRMTGSSILPPHAFESSLNFNAYGSTVTNSSSSQVPVITSSAHLSYKSMQCKTVVNTLTEDWMISNFDNSLPGILQRYYATSEHPTAFIWKLFDTAYFCESLASSMDETSVSETFQTGSATDHLVLFMQVIFNWIRGVERNLMEVEKQKVIIENIIETTSYNLKVVDEQLEIMGEIDEAQLMSQIEYGNTTKSNLMKLPTIGHKPIFSAHEIKNFLDSY